MKHVLAAVILLVALVCATACAEARVDSLTYAVFPYVPDAGYYQEIIERLAVDAHKGDDDDQVALAYDSGIGQGYIGFSESMRLLSRRADQTDIKSISFSDRENTPRMYMDAVAVTAGAEGAKYEKCLELMNVMAEADVLAALSVQAEEPQYLLLARRSPYARLAERFPVYARLEALAGNGNNRVILTP